MSNNINIVNNAESATTITKIKAIPRKRITKITVEYENEMPVGRLEEMLAKIYAKKIADGTLDIDNTKQNEKSNKPLKTA